jgi:chorismate dehydratase
VREWAPRISLPESMIRTYLNENIHYLLDDDCIAGVEHFFRLAAECGVLPQAPPLRFLK